MRGLETVAFAVLAINPGYANGQEIATSPENIVVPSLNFTANAEDVKNYWKYNYFHRSGVSFEEAVSDIRECRKRSKNSGLNRLNDFVPYERSSAGPTARAQVSNPYGLVGGVIIGAVTDGIMERNRRFNMRECMGFKNYRQYGLPKHIWSQINPDDPAIGDVIQAKIASGPQPAAEILP